MVALCNRADHYIFALWLLLSLFPRIISAAADWMSTILPHIVVAFTVNLRCRSETCCTRLDENTGPKKKLAKNRHLGTIAQLCLAISSQLRNILTIGKKLVKQHCCSNTSSTRPHNMANFGPLTRLRSVDQFGAPVQISTVSRLDGVTARHSSSGRQPNFAALDRGRHLYSAGRPSRWALAHISI